MRYKQRQGLSNIATRIHLPLFALLIELHKHILRFSTRAIFYVAFAHALFVVFLVLHLATTYITRIRCTSNHSLYSDEVLTSAFDGTPM